jgi:flagellar biosynthesis protein FlhB
MSDDSGGDKKFDLSQKQRDKLRNEGVVPKSVDISTTMILAVSLGILVTSGSLMIQYLRDVMINSFQQVGSLSLNMAPQRVGDVFYSGLWVWLGLFMGAIFLAVFVTQAAQVGLRFADDPFSFKFDKLNPVDNLKNLFSVNRLTQTGQSLVKLAVIASFTYAAFHEIQESAVFARPVSLPELGQIYVNISWSLGWRIVLALTVLAGADYGWQLWKFNHDHRMTAQDVKDERRQQEASPEVLKKRRFMQRKTSMRRMLEDMKDATIVVTNPTHYAVALRYRRSETDVPVVIAKGIRANALRLKERAYELRIAVREDRPLARGLYKYGRVGKPIPPLFYQGVAVILAQLFRQGFKASQGRTELTDEERAEIYNQDND